MLLLYCLLFVAPCTAMEYAKDANYVYFYNADKKVTECFEERKSITKFFKKVKKTANCGSLGLQKPINNTNLINADLKKNFFLFFDTIDTFCKYLPPFYQEKLKKEVTCVFKYFMYSTLILREKKPTDSELQSAYTKHYYSFLMNSKNSILKTYNNVSSLYKKILAFGETLALSMSAMEWLKITSYDIEQPLSQQLVLCAAPPLLLGIAVLMPYWNLYTYSNSSLDTINTLISQIEQNKRKK